jgi:glyoxylase-like metal-dependent hydrolase (beta-lactamase superfamily II)
VEDGARVVVGPGRELVMVETLGHARHHMSVLDASSGVVIAGDAVGIAFLGAAPYPALPPPDVDVERGLRSIGRLRELEPVGLCPAHFGPVADPGATLEEAERQLALSGRESLAAWRRSGTVAAVSAALERALPLEATVGDVDALERFRMLGWGGANAVGLAGWAERVEADGGTDAPSPGA